MTQIRPWPVNQGLFQNSASTKILATLLVSEQGSRQQTAWSKDLHQVRTSGSASQVQPLSLLPCCSPSSSEASATQLGGQGSPGFYLQGLFHTWLPNHLSKVPRRDSRKGPIRTHGALAISPLALSCKTSFYCNPLSDKSFRHGQKGIWETLRLIASPPLLSL